MCTFTFFAPFEYKRHLKFAHGLKHNNFKCVHCGHKMQSLSSLELHILKYHKGARNSRLTRVNKRMANQNKKVKDVCMMRKKSFILYTSTSFTIQKILILVYRKSERKMKYCCLCDFSSGGPDRNAGAPPDNHRPCATSAHSWPRRRAACAST